ncbi:MAG: PAS domain S-box protein, partial [Bdellovibrionales bacterium]|nr:PAS domain S-box protein [Bdellovibrionales bacterium]
NAFDHAHVALILYELDGTVIDMNQLALKLFGIERSALQLVTLRELLAPELIDIEKITEYWEKALNFDEQEFYLVGRNIQTEKTFEVCVHLARMKLASQNNILATIQRRQN